MKRFLILILFSLLFPMQNSSAVSPSLDETIDFLVNGDSSSKEKWSIQECVLTTYFKHTSGEYRERTIIDLNKVNLNSFKSDKDSFTADCDVDCYKSWSNSGGWKTRDWWINTNFVGWKRNSKALTHIYSNFCTGFKGAKSAF